MPDTFTRKLELAPTDTDKGEAIPCVIATATPVDRGDMVEILDCSAEGVDLSRQPLSLIVAHDQGRLAVGTVSDLQADGERVRGLVRFGSSDEAQQIRADVVAGTHRYLSVGYQHMDNGTETDAGIVFRWQPYEVSIVPVPADQNAGFFRSLNHGGMSMPATQPQTTVQQAQIRAADIIAMCQRHNVTHLAEGMIRGGQSVDQARAVVLEELARNDAAAGGHLNTRGSTHDGPNGRDSIINTLVQRMGGKVEGPTIRSTDLVGLAQRSLELSGQRVHSDTSRQKLVERALHTTSDFPKLLGDAVGRVLLEAYLEQPSAIKDVARRVDLPDFRKRQIVRLGAAPDLNRVNEAGEFTYGSIEEADAGWQLVTYGRIFSLTRQAIINDDLGGFADLIQSFGSAAARREADELANLLTGTPQVDDVNLFDQSRNTQVTDALDMIGLGAAVLALRKQKGIGGELITQNPGFLVVPAALEMTARQLVAQINAAKTSDVQPYSLQVQVEPRLDAANMGAHWFLVASNQRALEYGYLDHDAGPQITQREGFEVDGTEFKCRLDFGCGWSSAVGWVHATGANDHA